MFLKYARTAAILMLYPIKMFLLYNMFTVLWLEFKDSQNGFFSANVSVYWKSFFIIEITANVFLIYSTTGQCIITSFWLRHIIHFNFKFLGGGRLGELRIPLCFVLLNICGRYKGT
jgi:hypothetical protein